MFCLFFSWNVINKILRLLLLSFSLIFTLTKINSHQTLSEKYRRAFNRTVPMTLVNMYVCCIVASISPSIKKCTLPNMHPFFYNS